MMEYGPAIQASLGSVQLVDKLHVGLAGQYLELVASDPCADVISLLYRKVKFAVFNLLFYCLKMSIKKFQGCCKL